MNNIELWLGVLLISTGIVEMIGAERCRRQLEGYQDWFMTKNGWSRSIFGYWFFIGRPEIARGAIVTNEKLRRWVVYESYIKAFVLSIMGMLIVVRFQ
jgi:hypothetical protein